MPYYRLAAGASILLMTGHSLLIPAIYTATKHSFAVAPEALTSVFMASNIYHACLAFQICPANIEFSITKIADHVCATNLIMLKILQLLMATAASSGDVLDAVLRKNPGLTRDMVARDHFWSRFVFQLNVIISIFIFSTFDVNVSFFPTLAAVGVMLMLCLFKVAMTGALNAKRRYKSTYLIVGGLFSLASLALYPLADYFYSHNGWHFLSFIGEDIWQYGFVVGPDGDDDDDADPEQDTGLKTPRRSSKRDDQSLDYAMHSSVRQRGTGIYEKDRQKASRVV